MRKEGTITPKDIVKPGLVAAGLAISAWIGIAEIVERKYERKMRGLPDSRAHESFQRMKRWAKNEVEMAKPVFKALIK